MSDLDAMVELASLTGVGLTTLPKDRELLSKRIARAVSSFVHKADRPGGEVYLFVMEDLDTRKIVGACGIVSKVGGFEPFYSYHIETQLFDSKDINVHKDVPLLRLVEEHDGPCEIGSLFLHPDYRKHGNGKLLQLVRFLFMAEHRLAFESTVVSEIRGRLDERGHSPFWDCLGQHFFDIDFAEADRLSIVNKRFIADLMPDHPIYIPLLPRVAQEVIGKAHVDSERAVTNLEAEGFKFNNSVDIFDAGPVLSCERDEIRTIRQSVCAKLAGIEANEIDGPSVMISNCGFDVFRACNAPLVSPEAPRISASTAKALNVKVGDTIRFVPLDAA